ncbi:MAG: sporulation protein YabP [Eubacterium sp.]
MEQTISNQEQRLQMLNRKKIELTGVMEVISFDTQEVVLDTVEGQLRLEGEDLHVKKLVLERGEVEIQGKVRELAYKEPKIKSTSGGRIGRIFR